MATVERSTYQFAHSLSSYPLPPCQLEKGATPLKQLSSTKHIPQGVFLTSSFTIMLAKHGPPICRFPEMGGPPNHPFVEDFLHHPAVGVPSFLETSRYFDTFVENAWYHALLAGLPHIYDIDSYNLIYHIW